MLSFLRDRKTGIVSWMIVGGLSLFFVISFGPGSFGNSGCGADVTYAAKVNGREIPVADFEFAYNEALQREESQRQGRFGLEEARTMGLKNTVMDTVIETELLAQEAEKLKLLVSDDALHDFILTQEVFFKEGKFDYEYYTKLVRYYYRSSPGRFEERQRRRLMAENLRLLIQEPVGVAESELKEAFIEKNDKVSLKLVKIDPANFATELNLEGDALAKYIADNEKRLKEAFEERKGEYNKAEEVSASHVLIKVADTAPEAEKEAAKKKAEEIAARAKKGDDFAALAKEFSQDTGSAVNGGDLGFFARGRMVKPFEEAAFKLKDGEVSEPVKSVFGWHVIKRTGFNPAGNKSFDDVKSDLALKVMREEAALAAAKARAREIVAQLKAGAKPEELFPKETAVKPGAGADAAEGPKPDPNKITWVSAPAFTRTQRYISGVGLADGVIEAAFKLTPEAPIAEEPVENQKKLYVMVLESRETPDMAKFAEAKASLAQQAEYAKRERIVKEWLSRARDGAEVFINPAILEYPELDAVAASEE